jgi:hypothetical protein
MCNTYAQSPGESLVLRSDFLYMVARVDICVDYLKARTFPPITFLLYSSLGVPDHTSSCSPTHSRQPHSATFARQQYTFSDSANV